ncbi:MAG TPA: hypothetical protein GXZ32_01630 [Clostridiales bacterium]|nr:hypothetical protein [Clostridiales bacterium]
MTTIDNSHIKGDKDKLLGKTVIGVQMPNERVLNIFFSDKTKASITFKEDDEVSLSVKNTNYRRE